MKNSFAGMASAVKDVVYKDKYQVFLRSFIDDPARQRLLEYLDEVSDSVSVDQETAVHKNNVSAIAYYAGAQQHIEGLIKWLLKYDIR